jgi:GNAT superfamily N-acetyltransferase
MTMVCTSTGKTAASGARVTIRAATAGDAAAACLLLRRSIIECCVEDHRNEPALLASWLGNKTPENVAAWFASPQNHAIVAVLGEALAGVALLTRKGKICLCHLAPEMRGTGTGSLLLQALERQAADWGISTLQVDSTQVAQSFYRRHGYVAGRDTESSYGIETTLFTRKLPAAMSEGRPAGKGGCRCAGGERADEPSGSGSS